MLTPPSFTSLVASLFRRPSPALTPAQVPTAATSPSLSELETQATLFARWFRSHSVQRGLRTTGKRYDYLHYVGDGLPRWLTAETRPAFFDTESLFMPDDEEARATVAASPGMDPIRAQRLALGVVIDGTGAVSEWGEGRARGMVDELLQHDVIVSFNGLRFDNALLGPYCDEQRERQLHARTLDLMYWLQWRRREPKPRKLDDHAWELLRKRKVSLSSLVSPAVNVPSVFRRGRPEDVVAVRVYCHWDTDLVRDLYLATPGTMQERRSFYAWWLDEQAARLQRELTRTPPLKPVPADLPTFSLAS
jgi:hypothetical protein